MSVKEAERLRSMKGLSQKGFTLRQTSDRPGLSLKQTRRLWKRYLAEGAKGLIAELKREIKAIQSLNDEKSEA